MHSKPSFNYCLSAALYCPAIPRTVPVPLYLGVLWIDCYEMWRFYPQITPPSLIWTSWMAPWKLGLVAPKAASSCDTVVGMAQWLCVLEGRWQRKALSAGALCPQIICCVILEVLMCVEQLAANFVSNHATFLNYVSPSQRISWHESRLAVAWQEFRRLLHIAVRVWQCVFNHSNFFEGSNLWIWLSIYTYSIKQPAALHFRRQQLDSFFPLVQLNI